MPVSGIMELTARHHSAEQEVKIMSLLSKLFGKAGSELADKLAKSVANQITGTSQETPKHPAGAGNPASYTAPAPHRKSAPSGFSWGEEMPDEENQFNYNGPYDRYFEEIFCAEFPSYRLERQDVPGGKRVIFTFWDGGRKALVVELMPQSSDSQKLRRDCRASGIPYLRYYYNHDGWWNTRAYVVQRTRKALEG